MLQILCTFLICLTLLIRSVQAQVESPYCFSFTWLGPYVNKKSIVDENCEDRLGVDISIPCQLPLMATSNDNVPDTRAMWQNRTRLGYACKMEPGWSCVKYAYIFKHALQNITYMCAKVNATNGCYRQTRRSGMTVEACVCNSRIGHMPCNAALRAQIAAHILLMGLAGIIYT